MKPNPANRQSHYRAIPENSNRISASDLCYKCLRDKGDGGLASESLGYVETELVGKEAGVVDVVAEDDDGEVLRGIEDGVGAETAGRAAMPEAAGGVVLEPVEGDVRTAAEKPPHLAAINPWEGVSDVYRDLVMRGGTPDIGFARQLQDGSFFCKHQKEDIVSEVERYPLVNDLWKNKIPDFGRITVPAYVVASYSNMLHTAGTFRAWRRIASSETWLRIHNGQEWPDYYDEGNREDLRRFFDRYLKEDDNGWEQTPHVRYSLLDLEGGDKVNVAADQFPPSGVVLTKFFLDGRARTLTTEAPSDEVTASYVVASNPNAMSFVTRSDQETVMVGYPKARLWVEARGADDMDLFVLIQKLDAHGTPLQQFTVPNQSAANHDLTDHGATILRYKGSDGRLRVSARYLDEMLSTDEVPAHSFDRVEKLSPGEIAEVVIELLPIGLIFHPGEQLRFVISSRNLLGTLMPGIEEYAGANCGQHVIYTGGEHPSYLQVPIQAN